MMKTLLAALMAGIVAAGAQLTLAGDREANPTSRLHTGAAAGAFIAKPAEPAPVPSGPSDNAATPPVCPVPDPAVCAPTSVGTAEMPAPAGGQPPIYRAASSLYTVTYRSPDRGYAYDHYKQRSRGMW